MNRRITFGNRITLNYKPVRGLGVREVLLLGAAAAQAVYFVFLADTINFAVRLSVALFVALILLAIAVVPVRGYRVEHFIFIVLHGLVRPRRYLHQTAMRDLPTVDDYAAVSDEDSRPERTAVHVHPLEREGDWVAPNLAMVMVLFCAMLLIGSLLVYIAGTRLMEVRW